MNQTTDIDLESKENKFDKIAHLEIELDKHASMFDGRPSMGYLEFLRTQTELETLKVLQEISNVLASR